MVCCSAAAYCIIKSYSQVILPWNEHVTPSDLNRITSQWHNAIFWPAHNGLALTVSLSPGRKPDTIEKNIRPDQFLGAETRATVPSVTYFDLQCLSGNYSDFSTFCSVTALFLNGLNKNNSSEIYTGYPIMTKRKQVFRNICKCIKKQKCLIFISIQTIC